MKLRKSILLIVTMLSLFLLGACSSQNEEAPEEQQNTTETAETSEPITENHEETQNDVERPALAINLEEEISDPNSIAVLVNKEYSIGEYVPDDLVTVEVSTVLENPEVWQMRAEAAEALKEMFEAAAEEEIILHSRSGYRSYQTQVQLFNNYAATHGEEEANKFSSRPGHSEHQTGLSMDVTSESVNFQLTEAFGETKEGQWVAENAHDFGFIIRYPKGKSDITGYIYEPWHIRYLGEELATAVYDSGLTYEEFLVEQDVINPSE
jgi:D-alanyl-D-alanine carboxypeptidase